MFNKSTKLKVNYIFVVQISFCTRNAIKNETKNVNKSSLFYSIFVIFFIFLVWCLLFWNLIFTHFPITQQNLKKFHWQLFNVSHFVKVRSWISQFLKPDNTWTCNVLNHLKIFNFRALLKFTWIIITSFDVTYLFTQSWISCTSKISLRCTLL